MKSLRALALLLLSCISAHADRLEDLIGLRFGASPDEAHGAVVRNGGKFYGKAQPTSRSAVGFKFQGAVTRNLIIGFHEGHLSAVYLNLEIPKEESAPQQYRTAVQTLRSKLGEPAARLGEEIENPTVDAVKSGQQVLLTVWRLPGTDDPAKASYVKCGIGVIGSGDALVVQVGAVSGAYGGPDEIKPFAEKISIATATPKPPTPSAPVVVNQPPKQASAQISPTQPAPPPISTKLVPDGVTLTPGWDGRLQGGRDTLHDLERVLSDQVDPGTDVSPHPEITIYQGVRYLMPLDEALKLLGSPRRLDSKVKIACPGFPLNSFFVSGLDGMWEGHFNRLYIVTDRADKVVSIQLVDEHPKGDAAVKMSPMRTYNFVNARTKATERLQVRLDTKADKHVLAVHTSLHNGGKILEDVMWFLPRPLASLIRTSCQKGMQN